MDSVTFDTLTAAHTLEAAGIERGHADAILGRLVHNACPLNLKGESMRKGLRPLTQTGHRDS